LFPQFNRPEAERQGAHFPCNKPNWDGPSEIAEERPLIEAPAAVRLRANAALPNLLIAVAAIASAGRHVHNIEVWRHMKELEKLWGKGTESSGRESVRGQDPPRS
jgi:hypothetical protein